MIMVDRLVDCSDGDSTTNFAIREDNIFVEDGVFTLSGILENIAQTAAARIGYLCKYVYFKPVCIGFIGAVKSLKVYDYPRIGQTIETKIDIINSAFNIDQIVAVVKCEDKILAEGEMKISLTDMEI